MQFKLSHKFQPNRWITGNEIIGNFLIDFSDFPFFFSKQVLNLYSFKQRSRFSLQILKFPEASWSRSLNIYSSLDISRFNEIKILRISIVDVFNGIHHSACDGLAWASLYREINSLG